MIKFAIKKAVAIILLLLLFGCNGSSEIILEPKISATLTIKTENIEMKGAFTRSIDGTMEYTISHPEEMAGMKYKYSENMFTVYYHDMERSGELWHNSPVDIVFNAIDSGISRPLLESTVMTENGKCTYYIENNNIKKIEVDSIVATFE